MDKTKTYDAVKKYIAFLEAQDFPVRRAYLFGSYAKGNFDDDSDIDLAVVMNNLSNSYLMQIELMKISRKFDTRIEPHPFDESDFDPSDPFIHEILTTGIRIL
jgi:predicted nucleotidyltransferase